MWVYLKKVLATSDLSFGGGVWVCRKYTYIALRCNVSCRSRRLMLRECSEINLKEIEYLANDATIHSYFFSVVPIYRVGELYWDKLIRSRAIFRMSYWNFLCYQAKNPVWPMRYLAVNICWRFNKIIK